MQHQPLLDTGNRIINSDVEGQCKVIAVVPMRLAKERVGLGVVISLATAMLFALACSWSKRLTKRFFFHQCELGDATHLWILNEDRTYDIVKKRTRSSQIYFINRKLKYIYEEEAFRPLEYSLDGKHHITILTEDIKGIQNFESTIQQYGPCKIEIPIPSLPAYLFKELTAPFYILQYVTCFLWIAENYAVLAVVMITVSVVLTSVNYLLLLSSIKKLRELAQHNLNVKVIRQPDPNPLTISSEELVPGDVLIIEPRLTIPCDCVILKGEVMMNEASLTGESVPISKEGLHDTNQPFYFHTQKKNCLFEGTKVLVTKSQEGNHVLALVVRTGFSSFKGQIFRSVLYPKPQKFTFYTQAIKFLLGLAILILAIYFGELYEYITLGFNTVIIVFRLGDALTWIIPPALPIFVSMCMTFSLLRLRREHQIFGVESQKALIAGQVNTCCFDKTGTLTTTNIEVFGYQLVQKVNNVGVLRETTLAAQASDKSSIVFKLFASCHGVAKIEGELLGDSLDIEMFNFSGYEIIESFDVKQRLRGACELDVLKNHEFESSLQRMSVLVRDNSDGRCYIFCKGSPEKTSELSQSQSLPYNFKTQLDILTMKGLRVLGMGYREVNPDEVHRLMNGERQDMEDDLIFLGLLIMENKLKQDTPQVIRELRESGLDLKIISGDNGLTTIQCGRECSLLDPSQPMLLVDYNDRAKQLSLEEVDQQSVVEIHEKEPSTSYTDSIPSQSSNSHTEIMQKLVRHLLKSDQTIKQGNLQQKMKPSINTKVGISDLADQYGFAITGKAFDYFWAQNPENQYGGLKSTFAGFDDPLTDVKRLEFNSEQLTALVFTAIIAKAKIFARMRPEQKSQIIAQLQKQGRCVLMIGDGANDCAAIKQADVGVSFAQSDASYAAPFSTSGQSISSVKHVLLDGRASLSNAIEVFQYYIVVSVIKYIGAMLLALQGENFSTMQMITVNYVASLPFVMAICLSWPCKLLSKRVPEEDMFRLPNQMNIYFHIGVTSLGMIANYLYWLRQDWRTHLVSIPNGQYIQEGEAQTTLYLCKLVYFQMAMISIYISKPFKERIWNHKTMMVLMVIMTTINVLFFFSHFEWMYTLLQIIDLQQHGNYMQVQLAITLGISLAMIVLQELVIKRFWPSNKRLFDNNNRLNN